MTTITEPRSAVLDEQHAGDIRRALGTIALHDLRAPPRAVRHAEDPAALVGPGLIVTAGDNDAGAFRACGQAGQNYGTRLLWTLLLVPPRL